MPADTPFDLEVTDRLLSTTRAVRKRLDLTPRQFALLARLATEVDVPVSRADLLRSVWHLDFDPGSGVLDVQVSHLRAKLETEAWRLETVRGVGYRLRKSATTP